MSAAHAQFRYQPLPGDHIRLLRITPRDRAPDRLQCSLHTERLGAVEYEAISYTWGRLEPKEVIFVDEQPVAISPNIYTFLCILKQKQCAQPLWLDVVSINQRDLGEKSQQVALMGQIFHQASQVHVWLGNFDAARLRPAVDLFRRVTAIHARRQYSVPPHHAVGLRHGPWAGEWRAVAELFDVEYWDRLWVIQELHMARRKLVHVGTLQFDWALFEGFFGHFTNWKFTPDSQPLARRVFVRSLPARLRAQPPSGDRLERLIEQYGHAACAEPRDRVYGLLSLSHSPTSLPVNYEKSVWEIQADVLSQAGVANPLAFGQWLAFLLTASSAATPPPDVCAAQVKHWDSMSPSLYAAIERREVSQHTIVAGTVVWASDVFRGPSAAADIWPQLRAGLQQTGLLGGGDGTTTRVSDLAQSDTSCIVSLPITSGHEETGRGLFRALVLDNGMVGFGCEKTAVGDQVLQLPDCTIALVNRGSFNGGTVLGRAVLGQHGESCWYEYTRHPRSGFRLSASMIRPGWRGRAEKVVYLSLLDIILLTCTSQGMSIMPPDEEHPDTAFEYGKRKRRRQLLPRHHSSVRETETR